MTPKIEKYRFGEVVIDGQVHTSDVIVLPDRVRTRWWRKEGHSLEPDDLKEIFQSPPEVLVIGRGAMGRMTVPPETIRKLEEAGMRVLVYDTEQACLEFNLLREARKKVAAALHLTC
jgi:hypothetical protein